MRVLMFMLRSVFLTLGLSLLSYPPAAAESSGKLLRVKDKLYPESEKVSEEQGPHKFHSAVSRRNLLGLKRKTPFGLPDPSKKTRMTLLLPVMELSTSGPLISSKPRNNTK
jgi:hypothetical protein